MRTDAPRISVRHDWLDPACAMRTARFLLLLACVPAPAAAQAAPAENWPAYGHDPQGTRLSPLTDITPANEIFGGVVPWGEVWRTGANAATGFTTDADLKVGGTIVPKGSYTLWSLPSKHGAKLIVNSQTGQWGTDYHADKDFARLDLAAEKLAQPVETFTIAVDPVAGGGVLRLRWDRTQYSLPFTVQ